MKKNYVLLCNIHNDLSIKQFLNDDVGRYTGFPRNVQIWDQKKSCLATLNSCFGKELSNHFWYYDIPSKDPLYAMQ